jgi:hypothetical protein
MRTSGLFATAACLVAATWLIAPAEAGGLTGSAGAARFSVDVTSMREARFHQTVRQQYDFSCGSAAVATLLSYHYDEPTDEKTVFDSMWRSGDPELIESQGFSMLDMKRVLEARGYQADGFRVPLDRLAEAGIPGIVLINLRGYLHFVVVKDVTATEVLVGDPAVGLSRYDRDTFEAMWNGIVFVITSHMEVARANQPGDRDWRLKPPAPIGAALSREAIAAVSLFLPGRNDF